jgi:hypothetical protein
MKSQTSTSKSSLRIQTDMRTLISLSLLFMMALACGGPAGSKDLNKKNRTGIRLKSEKSLPIPDSATFSMVELGGNVILLDEPIASGRASVLIPDEADVVLILNVDGLPFLRTTVSANQIAEARTLNVLDPGEFNAVTTYLTGLLEVQENGSRSKARPKVGERISALLHENFGSTVTRFSQCEYSRFQNNEITTTEAFRQRLNRINLMRTYFLTFRQYETIDATGQAAVRSLYSAMFDEEDPVALLNALASPALPDYPGKGDSTAGISQVQGLAAEGVFLYENGALTVEELGAFFFAPSNFTGLMDKFLFSPTGQIVGTISGMEQIGVDVYLSGVKGYTANVRSDVAGGFQFDGLEEDSYTISASKPSLIFDVSTKTYTLAKSEQLQGVSFVNITDHGVGQVAPSVASTVLPEGYYDTVTVTGDANLISTNIVQGETIFGVAGTRAVEQVPGDGTASAADLRSGQTAYAGGSLVTGSLPDTSISANTTSVSAGYISATDLSIVDLDLAAQNIVDGVEILGVTGSAQSVGTNRFIHKTEANGGTFNLKVK